MSHDGWVGLHVLGVVLLLGNLIVTAVWKVLADRTRQVDVIAYAQRLVAVTDIACTAPGAILIAVSGGVLAGDVGGVTGPRLAQHRRHPLHALRRDLVDDSGTDSSPPNAPGPTV